METFFQKLYPRLLVSSLLALILIGSAFTASAQTVTVSVPPQKYIVEKIAGDIVKVNIMVPKGSDPHSFSAKSTQIKALSDSALFLGIGFPFEASSIPQITASIKNIKIIHTEEGVSHIKHSHDWHEELDPHIWTSPKAVATVAENTYNALVAAFPQHKASFDNGYAALKAEIEDIDNRLTALFSTADKKFLVYHPSYGYLARDYGLTQLPVEQDGKEPKANELKKIIDTAKAENIRLFIISPQQLSGAAQTVAKELAIPLTVIDNLAEDWGKMINTVYEAFNK